jgi:rare lipoprotein A (peptidoglycan hydrolase)
VSLSFAQRAVALAAAALLAGVLAFAVAEWSDSSSSQAGLPEAIAAPDGSWYQAVAGVSAGALPRESACGYRLTAKTLGIAHPVLPCGAKLYVEFGGKRALTQVIDRGPTAPGRELDVSPALAKLLRLHGVRRVEWAFARG